MDFVRFPKDFLDFNSKQDVTAFTAGGCGGEMLHRPGCPKTTILTILTPKTTPKKIMFAPPIFWHGQLRGVFLSGSPPLHDANKDSVQSSRGLTLHDANKDSVQSSLRLLKTVYSRPRVYTAPGVRR